MVQVHLPRPFSVLIRVTTKQVGDIAEAAVMAALLKAGKSVLVPFGDRSRYDLAIDNGDGTITRIQVKSGRMRNGVVQFNTVSTTRQNGRRVSTDYTGQIEMFAVYEPRSDAVYLVPASECAKGIGGLRLLPPKLNHPSIRYAKDFQLGC